MLYFFSADYLKYRKRHPEKIEALQNHSLASRTVTDFSSYEQSFSPAAAAADNKKYQ